jgi:hypothetical protein
LLDEAGAPLVGSAVNFRVSSGNGTLFSGSATSDSQGLVRERWTLGTSAGLQSVEIRAVDASGNGVVYATFHATAIAGSPASMRDMSGTNSQAAQQGQPLPAPIAVRIADIYDNPVPGIAVTFVPCTTCGSVTSGSTTTNSDGVAAANWTLGVPIGTQSLVVSTSGLPDFEFTAVAVQAPPSDPIVVLIQSGNGQSILQHERAPQPLRVQVADALGNGVPGVAVGFRAAAGSGYVTPATVNTNQYGFAQAYLFFHGAGQQQVEASVAALPPAVFTISVGSTPYQWDGEYGCGVSGDPANGFGFVIAQNVVQPPLPGETLFLRNISFDVTTGALSADVRMSLNIHNEITGVLSIDVQDRATGNGTYILYNQLTALESGTWVCDRR